MVGAIIAAAMAQAVITAYKDITGALALLTAQVFTLDFFGVVIQCTLEFEHQAVVEMKAEFDQYLFHGLQVNEANVVANQQPVRINQFQVNDAVDIAKQEHGAFGLFGICMQAAKGQFTVFNQFMI